MAFMSETLISRFTIEDRNYEIVQSRRGVYYIIRDGNAILNETDPMEIIRSLVDQIQAMNVGNKRPW